jgi:hypothetical protein
MRISGSSGKPQRHNEVAAPNDTLKWTEGHPCFQPAVVRGCGLAPFTS